MGQPQFTRITYNPFRNFDSLDLTFSDVIGAGSNKQILLYGQLGFVSKIVSMEIEFPITVGSTTGYRSIEFWAGDFRLFGANSAFNKELNFRFSNWTADTSIPADAYSQLLAQDKLYFDSNTPLRIIYYNQTNTASSAVPKIIKLLVDEERIG